MTAARRTNAETRIKGTVLRRFEDAAMFRPVWDEIVDRQGRGILDMDVTATFDWAKTLWESHLRGSGSELRALLLYEDGMLEGILPLYLSKRTVHHVRCRALSPISEFFSGRCGFLLRELSTTRLEAMLASLMREVRNWDVLVVTLVDGSRSEHAFLEVVDRAKYRCERVASETSPYIALSGTWDEYLRTLPSKFRWQLRNREKRLGERGEWQYTEITSDEGLAHFLGAVYEIEKGSWKQQAGTSVTKSAYQEAVFNELGRVAARNGWLSGHLLELNGEPIGYIYGLVHRNVFCGLKETFKDQYKELSPGHLIQMLTIKQLFARGVEMYDFMGECEEHKMVWTSRTYSRSTYIVYNASVSGFGAWTASGLVWRMKALLSRIRQVSSGRGVGDGKGRRRTERDADGRSKSARPPTFR